MQCPRETELSADSLVIAHVCTVLYDYSATVYSSRVLVLLIAILHSIYSTSSELVHMQFTYLHICDALVGTLIQLYYFSGHQLCLGSPSTYLQTSVGCFSAILYIENHFVYLY